MNPHRNRMPWHGSFSTAFPRGRASTSTVVYRKSKAVNSVRESSSRAQNDAYRFSSSAYWWGHVTHSRSGANPRNIRVGPVFSNSVSK
jgi:hypothetical protein